MRNFYRLNSLKFFEIKTFEEIIRATGEMSMNPHSNNPSVLERRVMAS